MPNDVTIKKIANYFDVSVNYLISDCERVSIRDNVISGQYAVFGNSDSQVNIKNEISLQEQELLSYFRSLSEVKKAKALIYIAEIAEKEEKNETQSGRTFSKKNNPAEREK